MSKINPLIGIVPIRDIFFVLQYLLVKGINYADELKLQKSRLLFQNQCHSL